MKTCSSNKKIPVILPIFHENNFITDFKQKGEIFNSHFSKQCTLLKNNSKIPSECPQKSNESFSSITFEINCIEKIIQNLDPSKSHGHDMVSICMFKPLNLLSKSCLETGQFRPNGKVNVVTSL